MVHCRTSVFKRIKNSPASLPPASALASYKSVDNVKLSNEPELVF